MGKDILKKHTMYLHQYKAPERLDYFIHVQTLDQEMAWSLTLPGIHTFNNIVLICTCKNRKFICTHRNFYFGTIKELHLYHSRRKKLLVIYFTTFVHSENSDFSSHLCAHTSGITQILNKRLWTRISPSLTLAEKQNIRKRNKSLESCATYFNSVSICRCRS